MYLFSQNGDRWYWRAEEALHLELSWKLPLLFVGRQQYDGEEWR
jgi:hypothetical protein